MQQFPGAVLVGVLCGGLQEAVSYGGVWRCAVSVGNCVGSGARHWHAVSGNSVNALGSTCSGDVVLAAKLCDIFQERWRQLCEALRGCGSSGEM